MASNYTRRISLYINGKEVKNDIATIRGEMQKLVNQQARMTIGSKEYVAATKEIKHLKGVLAEHNEQLKVTQSGIGGIKKMADGFNRYFGIITAGVASITGVIFSLRQAVDVANEFEKRVDNLSALTGLEGRELEYLSKQAKELSTSTIEGNIRITESADKIVDAYTKVGSKRPELLKVKEDLNAVTKEAMILAAAADGKLEPAVNGLTMVLNQFNLPASEARRVINVLAAGSKEGAGEVDYLTSGFEKAGSVASTLKVSVEELTGALETLAPRITEPEMAGRSLRNIMLILEQQTDKKLRPSVVGLGAAFENLAAKQLSITELSKLFGTENINAANILMVNTAETKKYTEAVTGTSIALEQAAKNTNNNASKLEQAKNKVQNLTIEFGQRLAPAMTFSTNAFAAFMRVAINAPDFFRRYNIAIIALTGAILAYNGVLIKNILVTGINNLLLKEGIGLKIKDAVLLQLLIAKEQLLTIWKGHGTVATKLATTAQYALNTAMKANPIGLVITAITALVVAIKLYDKFNANSIKLENDKAKALQLVKSANDVLESSYNKHQQQISGLNKLSAEQKKLLLEQVDATLKQAEAELILAEARKKNIEKQSTPGVWQTFWNDIKSSTAGKFGRKKRFEELNQQTTKDNAAENTKELSDAIADLRGNLSKLKTQKSDLNEIVNAEKLADEITGKAIAQLEEKQRYLQTALKNYEKGSKDYERISQKLDAVNKKLNSSTPPGGGSDSPAGTAAAISDAFQKVQREIDAADEEINKAIASGDSPLAAKWQEEKKAAELLLEAYKKTKEAIEQGWDLSRSSNSTNISTLQSIGAGIVKDSNGFSFTKRDGMEDTGPSQQIQDEEAADAALKDAKINAAISSAESINNAIFDITANRRQAEFDEEMALLDKKREAELANKNLTEAQKAAINEKYDKKSAALKTRQFKKEQEAAQGKALINGALAIVKTFAEYGFTPAGWVAAAAQGVATLAEIAVIKSQKPPQYYDGGFTMRSSNNRQPAGIVHANEYVVPEDGVSNPALSPLLQAIEVARQSGNLARLNTAGILNAVGSSGFNKGGYSSNKTPSPLFNADSNTVQDNNNLLMKAIQIMEKLNDKLDLPIEATVAIRGRKGLYETMQQDKDSQNNASL